MDYVCPICKREMKTRKYDGLRQDGMDSVECLAPGCGYFDYFDPGDPVVLDYYRPESPRFHRFEARA
jgi:Zn ribbon nucleic-acid-binding protein